jgi:hypothetical protein
MDAENKTAVEKRIEAEARRESIVQQAVRTADRMICERCEGDEDELLALTAEVALTFSNKVLIMARARIMRKDFIVVAERKG